MTPQLWLELSPSHIRHAQLAAVRQIPQGMHDAAMLPCFCIARTFYPADSVPPAFLWPGATVGWVGAPKFFAGFRFREAALQPDALKAA